MIVQNQIGGALKPRLRLPRALAAVCCLFGWTSAMADPVPIPPQTKIRVTIVQRAATKQEYQKLDVLGGDFQVSDNSTIFLPLLGSIPVGEQDAAALAMEIAKRLKDKIGLVKSPDATVAIIDYAPIYVVGDVKTPGEYRFHAGLTVLQSLAMGGGEFREDYAEGKNKIGLAGLLREFDNSILRTQIRIARLRAEVSGAKKIQFEPRPDQAAPLAATIFMQEEAIFSARANLLQRQSKSYSELRGLLAAEIENLEEKTEGADADIESVQNELRRIRPLVEKRIALPAQQSDLERRLRSYYAGRLDLATAVMRARQGISEASRNLEALIDKQRSDAALELQVEQANLDQLILRRETARQQLLDAFSQSTDQDARINPVPLTFNINRRIGDSVKQFAASENSPLQPGDVVRVTRSLPKDPESSSVGKMWSLFKDQEAGANQ